MRHGSNSSQQYQSSYNVPTVNQPVYPARHAPNFRRHRLEDVIATARRQRLSNSANEQGQVEIVDLEDDEEQRGRYAAEEAESRARLPEELVGDEDDVFQQGELYGMFWIEVQRQNGRGVEVVLLQDVFWKSRDSANIFMIQVS